MHAASGYVMSNRVPASGPDGHAIAYQYTRKP